MCYIDDKQVCVRYIHLHMLCPHLLMLRDPRVAQRPQIWSSRPARRAPRTTSTRYFSSCQSGALSCEGDSSTSSAPPCRCCGCCCVGGDALPSPPAAAASWAHPNTSSMNSAGMLPDLAGGAARPGMSSSDRRRCRALLPRRSSASAPHRGFRSVRTCPRPSCR